MMRRYKIFQNSLGHYRVVKYIWWIVPWDSSHSQLTLEGMRSWIEHEEEEYRMSTWSKVEDHPAEFYQTAARLKGRP